MNGGRLRSGGETVERARPRALGYGIRIASLAALIGWLPEVRAAGLPQLERYPILARFLDVGWLVQPTRGGHMGKLFSAPEMGEYARGKMVAPLGIESCELLSLDPQLTQALVWVTTSPPTEATKSHVGVLLLLVKKKGIWHIADLKKFTATGRDSGVEARATGYHGAGIDLISPPVTITEFQGGRGFSCEISATYNISDRKLVRRDLE